jgi:BON domain-containing protein
MRKNVLDELDFEPSIDAANIGVAVSDGVVTLTGHVSSYAEKLAAERATDRSRACAQLPTFYGRADGSRSGGNPSDQQTECGRLRRQALDNGLLAADEDPDNRQAKVQ